MCHPTRPMYLIDVFLRDRLLDHLATEEGGEDAPHQRYSAHPQVLRSALNQFAL